MPKTFSQAVHEWWQKFDAMKVGTAYCISECTEKPEVFIAVAKDYIDHSEFGYQYDFDNEYKFFRRRFNDEFKKED
jgi:hypothetical protein